MICTRCGRQLTREPVQGMGPRCAQIVLGHKPRRRLMDRAARRVDERQADLFGEVRP